MHFKWQGWFALWDIEVRGVKEGKLFILEKLICKCGLLRSGGGFDFAREKLLCQISEEMKSGQ